MLRLARTSFQKLNVRTFEKSIITKGNGLTPMPGNMVSVHYTGKLEDGSVFDSSRTRAEPLKFAVGVGQVIRAWDEGVLTMRVGERAELICGPDYAYGARGFPPVIPANATLVFDVELLDVQQ